MAPGMLDGLDSIDRMVSSWLTDRQRPSPTQGVQKLDERIRFRLEVSLEAIVADRQIDAAAAEVAEGAHALHEHDPPR